MFSTLDILTLVVFGFLFTLSYMVLNRIRGWRSDVRNDLAADVSRGVFVGTSTEITNDGLPSIIAPPDELTRDMRRAGYYKPTAAEEFRVIRIGSMLLCVVITSIFLYMVGTARRDMVWPILGVGGGALAAAYLLPWIWLKLNVRARIDRIERALPDGFDMLSMCLTGGMGIHEALGHVSREVFHSHPDLGTELEIVRRQSEMISLGDAFKQFAARVDAPEVQSLAAMVTQGERLGSNMVNAFRDYADGVRLKQRQTADERANKASFKMLFPVLLLLLSAMIILWGPAGLELRNFFRNYSAVDATQMIRAQR